MKLLAQDARPSGGLALYQASGVLGVLYPELAAVAGTPRPEAAEDLWIHSLLLVDALPAQRPLLRLAALLHGLGVPGGGAAMDRDEGSAGRSGEQPS